MPEWIDRKFPNAAGRHTETSPRSRKYNCIAWAAGESHRSWANPKGYYWPPNCNSRTSHIESLKSAFRTLGYEACDDGDSELGFEKVALYELRGEWKHAVRQLPNGRWTSKMGIEGEDVEIEAPDCLMGDRYGDQIHYMKRPIIYCPTAHQRPS